MSNRGKGQPIISRAMQYAKMKEEWRVPRQRKTAEPTLTSEPTKYIPQPIPTCNPKYKISAVDAKGETIIVSRDGRREAEKTMGALKRLRKWIEVKLDW